MNLKALISNANQTYSLGLDPSTTEELHGRLRLAGFQSEVTAEKTSVAIDTILKMSDQTRASDSGPRAVYASLKKEAVADHGDECPRCRAGMKQVKLVGSRNALYCQACNITLPTRIE